MSVLHIRTYFCDCRNYAVITTDNIAVQNTDSILKLLFFQLAYPFYTFNSAADKQRVPKTLK